MLFEQTYSHSPKTAESHMTLMTGLYPTAHGIRNWEESQNQSLSPGVETLAATLQKEGYRTLAYVGGGNVGAALGFDRGFEVYEHARGVERVFRKGAEALKQLVARPADGNRSPFFLFLHTFEVHDPYTPPAASARLYTNPD